MNDEGSAVYQARQITTARLKALATALGCQKHVEAILTGLWTGQVEAQVGDSEAIEAEKWLLGLLRKGGEVTVPDEDQLQPVVKAVAMVLADAVLRLVENDPHQFSARPCATCTGVSSIMGRDYGCVRKAKGR